MGRTLESLRQVEGQRNGHDKPAASSSTHAPPAQATALEDDYLYIEVGGPGKQVDGSPAVLAASIPQKHAPVPKIELRATTTTPAQPSTLAVDFEPWSQPIPTHGLPDPEVICYHQPDHPASKQYAGLLERMLATLADGKSPVLLMAGLSGRSGTSTVLLNLAFTACLQRKQRVVVVDANLRQPALADRLAVAPIAGLNEVLVGAAALDAGLGKTLYPLLHILPAKTTPHAGEVLATDALRWLMLRLRERFDLILVDGPHLGDHPELPALMTSCDGLFLVMKQTMVEPADKPKLAKILSRLGNSLKGLIHARLM